MANRLGARPSSFASDGVDAPVRARAVRAPSRLDPANLLGAPLRRLREDWRDPLLRNGYALIVNIGATSLLGFLYWLLAAHLYPRSAVGLASSTGLPVPRRCSLPHLPREEADLVIACRPLSRRRGRIEA